MATAPELDEKNYELNRFVIYSVTSVNTDKSKDSGFESTPVNTEKPTLLYVGVGSANDVDIFVELRDLTMRAILHEPREIQNIDPKTKRYTLMHVMSADQNTQEDAIELARRLSEIKKPVHPFRTGALRASYMHLTI